MAAVLFEVTFDADPKTSAAIDFAGFDQVDARIHRKQLVGISNLMRGQVNISVAAG